MVFLISIIAITMFTRSKNYGVPKVFGYQFMVVKTDSMEPTLKVGTLILVKDIPMSEFKPQEKDEQGNITYLGDIITFYDNYTRKAVITHRLLSVKIDGNGKYSFTATGDNQASCGEGGCIGKIDNFNEDAVLGKMIYNSNTLGSIYNFLAHPVVLFGLIFVPLGYLTFTTFVDIKKGLKEGKGESNEKK